MGLITVNKCKCGEQPYYSGYYDNGLIHWEVRCLNCGHKSYSRSSKEEATKEWNVGLFNN